MLVWSEKKLRAVLGGRSIESVARMYEMAYGVRISPQTIKHWLTGGEPGVTRAVMIGRLFGVDVIELLDSVDPGEYNERRSRRKQRSIAKKKQRDSPESIIRRLERTTKQARELLEGMEK